MRLLKAPLVPSRRVLALAAALLTLPAPALADDDPRQGEEKPGWQRAHAMEVGLYLGAYFPPRAHELYELEVGHQPLDRAAFIGGLRLGYFPITYLGLEIEGGVMPTALRDVDESALAYHFRGHVVGQYPWRLTPFLLAGYGLMGIASGDSAVGNDLDGTFHAGLGLKFYILDYLTVRLEGRVDVGGRRGDGGFSPHFEALAGLAYQLWYHDDRPPRDSDGDGVPDREDSCPEVKGTEANGCPPDQDGDGVFDHEDKCPDVAAKTRDGCPKDSDGDGIWDIKDKCPEAAGPAPGGCPPDKDGDGVPDARDKCPDVPAKTEDGCLPDGDKDGVPDGEDKCPDTPETRNGYQDDDGCPDELPKKIKRFKGTIKGIRFELDSDKIRKSSYRTLDAAVAVLNEYEDLRLLIRGHADETGTDEYNVDLSRRRAEQVKVYLVGKGIEEKRLRTEGVGSAEPLAEGKGASARAKNRRIEFRIITD